MKENFHDTLRSLMDEYAHSVYDCTLKFPKAEAYGVTSQLKRSALSVVLNYVEGFGRQQKNTYRHFLEISCGSLKESLYLIDFSYKRTYLNSEQCKKLTVLGERIGGMLWGIISKIKNVA